MRWDDATQQWVAAPHSASAPPSRQPSAPIISRITHMAVQVTVASCDRPAQASVKLSATAALADSHAAGGLVLKARFRGCALPVSLQPSGQAATTLGSEGSHELCVTLDLGGLPSGQDFATGVAMLEVWQGRTVLQSVPLLLLAPHQAGVAEELSGLYYSACCDPVRTPDGSYSNLVTMLGLCLENAAPQLQPAAIAGIDSAAVPVHPLVAGMARSLLSYALSRGWEAVAEELMALLTQRCGVGYKELASGEHRPDGSSLLREWGKA